MPYHSDYYDTDKLLFKKYINLNYIFKENHLQQKNQLLEKNQNLKRFFF